MWDGARLIKYAEDDRVYNPGKKTIETFLYAHMTKPDWLFDSLDAYQINGKDKKGNVYFTGYFTPVIEVSAQPTPKYTYPIYTRPDRQKWSGPEAQSMGCCGGKRF